MIFLKVRSMRGPDARLFADAVLPVMLCGASHGEQATMVHIAAEYFLLRAEAMLELKTPGCAQAHKILSDRFISPEACGVRIRS
jgi:hypothetical protein